MSHRHRAGSRSASPAKHDDESDDVCVCQICKKNFSDPKAHIMVCEKCEVHFCRSCVGLKAAEYKALKDRGDFLWFCPPCQKVALKTAKQDFDIEKRCKEYFEKFTKRVENLEEGQKKLQKDHKTYKEATDARLEKLEQGSGAAGGAKSDALSRADVTKAIQKEINTSDKEKEEREKRKPNIIIFDMPEAKEITKEAVKKADLTEFLEVCTDVLEVPIEVEEVKTSCRIGKKDKDKN